MALGSLPSPCGPCQSPTQSDGTMGHGKWKMMVLVLTKTHTACPNLIIGSGTISKVAATWAWLTSQEADRESVLLSHTGRTSQKPIPHLRRPRFTIEQARPLKKQKKKHRNEIAKHQLHSHRELRLSSPHTTAPPGRPRYSLHSHSTARHHLQALPVHRKHNTMFSPCISCAMCHCIPCATMTCPAETPQHLQCFLELIFQPLAGRLG